MPLKTLFFFSNSARNIALALAVTCSWIIPTAMQAAITPSAGASLEWNSNPESDVSGYKVYIGTASGIYPTVIDVAGATRTALPVVSLGTTLYIAVSAYNSAGLESPRSAELSVIADVPAPAASTSFAMSSPGQGQLRWRYPKNATVAADRFTVYASEDLVNWFPASDILIGSPASSDSEWLYFEFPYTADKPQMFFQVGASNAFGEIR